MEFAAETMARALKSLRNPLRDGHCIFEGADSRSGLLQKLEGDIGLLVVLVWPRQLNVFDRHFIFVTLSIMTYLIRAMTQGPALPIVL